MTIVIDYANWAWPQWAIIFLSALGLIIVVVKHGEPKSFSRYSIGETVFNTAVTLALLMAGGFFS